MTFLTPAEVAALTGYKRPAQQRAEAAEAENATLRAELDIERKLHARAADDHVAAVERAENAEAAKGQK